MLEFKGITFETFENYYPDNAEALFYGASFEEHIYNVSYWCGASFEEKLALDINTLFMFSEI